MQWRHYQTWEAGLLAAFTVRLIGQIPGGITPEQYLKIVDTTSTWTGYKWACAIVVFFTMLFLLGIWYGIRVAKSVVKENRDLNNRYTAALEKYATLLATFTEKAQDLTRGYEANTRETQEIVRNTNSLIKSDIEATNNNSERSKEQTRAFEELKNTIQRLWDRGGK